MDRRKVSQYLGLMKSFAQNEFVISPRAKNRDFLLSWGIDFETAKDIVLCLQSSDYVSGPCPDDKGRSGRNDVWVFGKRLMLGTDEVEAYIKMTQSQTASGVGCLCVSFHEAEYSMAYAFGGEQREVYILP